MLWGPDIWSCSETKCFLVEPFCIHSQQKWEFDIECRFQSDRNTARPHRRSLIFSRMEKAVSRFIFTTSPNTETRPKINLT